MKIGDRISVQVSRDKIRSGTLIDDSLPNNNVEVLYDLAPNPVVVDKTKVSGFENAVKHDNNKIRMELIPVEAIEEIGKAFTFGATKYTDNNWRKGFEWERLRGSAMRHLLAWSKGEDLDPESGLSHLAHLGACVAMLITHEKLGYGEDNRVKSKTIK